MADLIATPRAAFADVLRDGRYGRPDGAPGLILCERAELSLATVIARSGQSQALAALVRSAYGIDLPSTPRIAARSAPRRAVPQLHLGRLRTMAGARRRRARIRARAHARPRQARLDRRPERRALRSCACAGRKRARCWPRASRIDLHPRAFKPGDVALTIAAHIGVQLWQVDEAPTYEIAVPRSLARSLWAWLSASAAEFGYEEWTSGEGE